jgi:hypothetical protein
MGKLIVTVLALAGVAAAVAKQAPELKRYMKIRSM